MIDLHGKTALVTGGSRGIGRAVAERLAGQGAEVILTYVRHRTQALETMAAIEAAGGRCRVLRANLADEESLDALITELRVTVPRLDIVVSNAASGVLRPAMELTARHWTGPWTSMPAPSCCSPSRWCR